MLDAETIDSTKQSVRIVNVARRSLIDEVALVEALERGRVASVALDLFEAEPFPQDSPLRRFPQNIFGSHNSSDTLEAVCRMSRRALSLPERYLSYTDRSPRHGLREDLGGLLELL